MARYRGGRSSLHHVPGYPRGDVAVFPLRSLILGLFASAVLLVPSHRASAADFSVGQRVQAAVNSPDGNANILIGDTGTIVCVLTPYARYEVLVNFDKNVGGHDGLSGTPCAGMAQSGHGWYMSRTEFQVISGSPPPPAPAPTPPRPSYSVGQRFEATMDSPDGNFNIHVGDTGTIVCVLAPNDYYDVLASFDNNIGGHDGLSGDCAGKAIAGHGWYLWRTQFKVVTATPPPPPTPPTPTPTPTPPTPTPPTPTPPSPFPPDLLFDARRIIGPPAKSLWSTTPWPYTDGLLKSHEYQRYVISGDASNSGVVLVLEPHGTGSSLDILTPKGKVGGTVQILLPSTLKVTGTDAPHEAPPSDLTSFECVFNLALDAFSDVPVIGWSITALEALRCNAAIPVAGDACDARHPMLDKAAEDCLAQDTQKSLFTSAALNDHHNLTIRWTTSDGRGVTAYLYIEQDPVTVLAAIKSRGLGVYVTTAEGDYLLDNFR
jgi:hypothetical protein